MLRYSMLRNACRTLHTASCTKLQRTFTQLIIPMWRCSGTYTYSPVALKQHLLNHYRAISQKSSHSIPYHEEGCCTARLTTVSKHRMQPYHTVSCHNSPGRPGGPLFHVRMMRARRADTQADATPPLPTAPLRVDREGPQRLNPNPMIYVVGLHNDRLQYMYIVQYYMKDYTWTSHGANI